MEESLFESLNRVIPSQKLTLQYRMCGPINEVANNLTYHNRLKCGNDSVRDATLRLPFYSSFAEKKTTQQWLIEVINPSLRNAFVFLDTSLLGEKKAHRHTTDESIENQMESDIILSIVSALNDCGITQNQIGIIAPYKSQVKHLQRKTSSMPHLEINTIDQYQGRDKEVIIFSCTRSVYNMRSRILESPYTVLDDFRRLTVAVTRAKYKLIIIGDKETLWNYPPFEKLFKSLAKSQWYKLCPGKDKF